MIWGHKSELESISTSFVRAQSIFLTVIGDMEKEMQRMRERKLNQELIDAKDLQIENLVTFYNRVDEIIAFIKISNINLKIENHFLTDLVSRKVSVDELMQYKPSKKVELVNIQSAESVTLTEFSTNG
jgi:hypothetical protein